MNNAGMTDPNLQLGINGGLKSWGLIMNIGISFFIDRIGRRPIYLISTIGTTVAFIIWTIISARLAIDPVQGLAPAFVFMIFVYGTFYDFK
jgi:hypothetical protein